MFCNFMSIGKLPVESRSAVVTPIAKYGKPNDVAANYRLISLISVICKVLRRHGAITKHQHGFFGRQVYHV
jgi:hypothetical protein